MSISPLAGKPADPAHLADLPKLVTAYYQEVPDPAIPAQRVSFGTSGHRGSAFDHAFNEAHILAITQAICLYRTQNRIAGPLFLGMDTHALSAPALATALEVLTRSSLKVWPDVSTTWSTLIVDPSSSHTVSRSPISGVMSVAEA